MAWMNVIKAWNKIVPCDKNADNLSLFDKIDNNNKSNDNWRNNSNNKTPNNNIWW